MATYQFGDAASLSGLLSARPAPDPMFTGRFYLATDEGILYRDNGEEWIPARQSQPALLLVPLDSSGLLSPGGITLEFEGGEGTWQPFNIAAAFNLPANTTAIVLRQISASVQVRGGSATSGGETPAIGTIYALEVAEGNIQINYAGDVSWEVQALFYTLP